MTPIDAAANKKNRRRAPARRRSLVTNPLTRFATGRPPILAIGCRPIRPGPPGAGRWMSAEAGCLCREHRREEEQDQDQREADHESGAERDGKEAGGPLHAPVDAGSRVVVSRSENEFRAIGGWDERRHRGRQYRTHVLS